jgi:imidazolonepropionase-like amidohydrolase
MLAALRVTVQAANARGIPIAAGTDTSYTTASLSSVVTEIKALFNLGLPRLTALRAATTVNASLLAREREIGRLKPGYAADAVVVGANPLDDLAALDDIRLIVAGGWVAREGA